MPSTRNEVPRCGVETRKLRAAIDACKPPAARTPSGTSQQAAVPLALNLIASLLVAQSPANRILAYCLLVHHLVEGTLLVYLSTDSADLGQNQ